MGSAGDVERLVFNGANPVTDVVERRPFGDGTAVVKVLRADGDVVVDHWVTSADTSHWNLWNREDRAYASGLTDAFAVDGIRSPRLVDRVVRGDGAVELWLEDVAGRPGAEFDLADHARFARRLGAAQGRWARPGARPRHDWLSRGWLRAYALSRPPGPSILSDAAAWEHPVVVEGFGDERHRIRARFAELYDDADRWLGLLESLPRTLCHLDCWPNNAIAADDGTDVAIDWSFVGDGAVGEDPGNWVPDTLFDHFLEPEVFGALDRAVWTNYADGLASAGWPHDPDVARLAMCASAVKYVWLPGLMVWRADHDGPTGYGGREGYPLAEVFRRRAVAFDGILGWLDEAAALADALGLAP
jgi:hypothetical protein